LTQIQEVALKAFLLIHQLHLVPLEVKVPLLLNLDLSPGLVPVSLEQLAPLLQLLYLRPCPPQQALDLPDRPTLAATVLALQTLPLRAGLLVRAIFLYPQVDDLEALVMQAHTHGFQVGLKGTPVGELLVKRVLEGVTLLAQGCH